MRILGHSVNIGQHTRVLTHIDYCRITDRHLIRSVNCCPEPGLQTSEGYIHKYGVHVTCNIFANIANGKVAVSLLSITNQSTCKTNDRIVDSESELE